MLRSVAALAAAVILCACPAAAATTPCGERSLLVARLAQHYTEAPIAMGLDSQGRMLEVLAAPSGTWTILVTTAGGLTCLVASGTAWVAMAPMLAGSPS